MSESLSLPYLDPYLLINHTTQVSPTSCSSRVYWLEDRYTSVPRGKYDTLNTLQVKCYNGIFHALADLICER